MDFAYSYSDDPLAERLFPGHVHRGLFDIFKQIQAEVVQASGGFVGWSCVWDWGGEEQEDHHHDDRDRNHNATQHHTHRSQKTCDIIFCTHTTRNRDRRRGA